MQISKSFRFPDFLCIGAQKAGTTWLHKMLGQHPDIWLPPLKEIHYFDRLYRKESGQPGTKPSQMDTGRAETTLRAIQWTLDSQLPTKDKIERISFLSKIGRSLLTDEWYGEIFQMAPKSSSCGEITPEYALLPDNGVQHILRLQPKVKIIFIMRDPIDRGWSHLRMDDSKGYSAHLTVVQRAKKNGGFLNYSDYMPTINRFLEHISRENFLTLYFDDIIEQPELVLRKVCEFLNLYPSWSEFKRVDEPVHVGQIKTMEPELYEIFLERMAPIYERLLSLKSPIVEKWYGRHYGEATKPS